MISLYLPGHFIWAVFFVTGLGFVKIKKEHRLEFLEFGKGLKKESVYQIFCTRYYKNQSNLVNIKFLRFHGYVIDLACS